MITITRIKYSNNINSVDKKKKKTYFNVNPPIAGGTPDSDRGKAESRGREPRPRAKAESPNGHTHRNTWREYYAPTTR